METMCRVGFLLDLSPQIYHHDRLEMDRALTKQTHVVAPQSQPHPLNYQKCNAPSPFSLSFWF